MNGDVFISDKQRLNLVENQDKLYECSGRIQGEFPIYIHSDSLTGWKLIESGGVLFTMTDVRNEFWIPKLRQVVKEVINKCNGCKRFHSCHYSIPKPGLLPHERNQGTCVFQIIGIDFEGSLQ